MALYVHHSRLRRDLGFPRDPVADDREMYQNRKRRQKDILRRDDQRICYRSRLGGGRRQFLRHDTALERGS